MKGVVIDANSGGYCTLALIGLPQVSLQDLDQLFRRHSFAPLSSVTLLAQIH